jgi:hypothetical protein
LICSGQLEERCFGIGKFAELAVAGMTLMEGCILAPSHPPGLGALLFKIREEAGPGGV